MFRGFVLYILLTSLCSDALIDCDRATDEMPELSDGDEDGDDEEQWMEEGDTEQVNVPCLFCHRWDYATVKAFNNLEVRQFDVICFGIVLHMRINANHLS